MIFAHGACIPTVAAPGLARLQQERDRRVLVVGVAFEIVFSSSRAAFSRASIRFACSPRALRWAALRFALIAEFAHVIVPSGHAQALHAATFAVHHSASFLTIQRWFHGRATARGQALYVSIGYGVGGSAGSLLAAWLWSSYGASARSSPAAWRRCSAGWRFGGRASTTPPSARMRSKPERGRRRAGYALRRPPSGRAPVPCSP